jgi:hypothetical protein
MLLEREENINETGVLLIKTKKDSDVIFEPVVIEEDGSLKKLIINQKKEMEDRIRNLEKPPSKHLAHGIRRRSRQRKEVAENRQKQIAKEMALLAVLNGNVFSPIEILEEKGKKRIKLTWFEDDLQKNWWTFVKDIQKLINVAYAYKSYPEGLDILFEAFRLRTIIRDGTVQESDKAREVYNNQLLLRASSIPEEYSHLFTPIFGEITRRFPPRTEI